MRYDIQAQFDRLCTLYRGGFDAMVTQSLWHGVPLNGIQAFGSDCPFSFYAVCGYDKRE